jgi:diadenosine tetraphosphate (Ap4A) HIT family hydrolase
MHATLQKFGAPATVLRSYAHWHILLRPSQVTLSSLVLCSDHDLTSLSALPLEAFAELKQCTSDIEKALRRFRAYDRINYLALMMVDPHVHFHVIPRYAAPQPFNGHVFTDAAYPGPPDLKWVNTPPDAVQKALHTALLDAFAQVV